MEEDLFEEEKEERENSESEEPEVFDDDRAPVLSNADEEDWDDDDDEEEWVSLEDDELEEGLTHYIDADDTEEEPDIGSDPEDVKENAEVPPWHEEIEIPAHDTGNIPKRLFLTGIISFTVALIGIGLFIFLKTDPITDISRHGIEEEKEVLFVTKKVPDIPVKDAAPAEKTEGIAEPVKPVVKENARPVISGDPVTIAHEGVLYCFVPMANDADSEDNLTFFIANQPDWTSFDTTTGALTGTPQKDHVGVHENIDILVSDGSATASLPLFDITVIGAGPVETPKTETQAPPEQINVDLYTLPDVMDLIKLSEFMDAAIEYHKSVRHVPKAYTLKLEVDCVEASVLAAYQNGDFDNRMFILPKDIKGKPCFIVFWGLYATKDEALKALSTVPAYFRDQDIKPKLTIIKQYL